MSHDQRPGKMRVVGGAAGAAAPARRRRGDPARGSESANGVTVPGTVLAGTTAAGAAADTRPLPVLGIALFLLGCATGGAILTLLGVFA